MVRLQIISFVNFIVWKTTFCQQRLYGGKRNEKNTCSRIILNFWLIGKRIRYLDYG